MFFAQTLPPAHEYILYTNLPNLATFAMRKEPTNGSAWLQSDTAIDLLLPPHPRLAGEASRLFAVIFVTADFNICHCEKRLLFCRDVAIPRKGSALFQSGTATNLLLPLIRHFVTPSPRGRRLCKVKTIRLSRKLSLIK